MSQTGLPEVYTSPVPEGGAPEGSAEPWAMPVAPMVPAGSECTPTHGSGEGGLSIPGSNYGPTCCEGAAVHLTAVPPGERSSSPTMWWGILRPSLVLQPRSRQNPPPARRGGASGAPPLIPQSKALWDFRVQPGPVTSAFRAMQRSHTCYPSSCERQSDCRTSPRLRSHLGDRHLDTSTSAAPAAIPPPRNAHILLHGASLTRPWTLWRYSDPGLGDSLERRA
ncbi:Hypothetical predicted protein [Pelobates cultripes]|uniref:Uncharacterized protein n=1 Tax=Pelobates cultripes TaxID=61616 RepID=A0AAD1VZD1_PELCU|nr:Hypothetical predicted protein [Pelobates cultripes]